MDKDSNTKRTNTTTKGKKGEEVHVEAERVLGHIDLLFFLVVLEGLMEKGFWFCSFGQVDNFGV